MRRYSILSFSAQAVVVAAVLLSVTSCSTSAGRDAQGRPRSVGRPTDVASPLTTTVPRADLLASVNSIEIARPAVPTNGGPVSVGLEDAQRMVEQVARETMTLKVSTTGASSAAGRRGDPSKGSAAADAVLVTELLRFEERQGSAIGGEPAVVSFRMSLRAAPAGTEVWGAQYFYRQEAVSENLLRLNERVGSSGYGAGWRSANELFKRGVGAALQDFNNQREKRFLTSSR